MAIRLDLRDADFERRFEALLATKRELGEDVGRVVADIIDDVRVRGDVALLDYIRRFDRVQLEADGLRVEAEEVAAALSACDAATLDALRLAAARITDYHRRQMPADHEH